MNALTPFFITGYDKGLTRNKKPFLLADQAWETLYNGYVWRDRELKREGNQFLGRLQRNFVTESFFVSAVTPWTFNLKVVTGFISAATKANPGHITTPYPHNLTTGDMVVISGVVGMTQLNGNTYTITVVSASVFSIGTDTSGYTTYISGGTWISNRSLSATEPNAQIVPGSFVLATGGVTFTDNGDGTITSGTPLVNFGNINYNTGSVTLTTNVSGSTATIISYSYYPGLPGMGIWQKETSTITSENTIWWDTKYAYIFSNGEFQEFIPGTAWNGNDSDFFWAYNYQASSGSSILFVTNDNNGQNSESAADPMYYTDGATWTTFQPLITTTSTMFQALILIPYWGRLIALNTWEGSTSSGAADSTNFFNRCRFSAANASPVASTSWRTDIFGQGGSLDAPVDEEITGCTFVKNTLIVDFEYSTWQLRYVGEYGLPFIWERVSADYGSGSTFSGVLFDNQRLNVGDVAITAGNAVGVDRIDLDIPDQVFSFQNEEINNGAKRVWGVRDYVKELVYWCYPDSVDQVVAGTAITYPNKVLLYNYRNNSWAIFRDSVTAFGTFQIQTAGETGGAVNWNSQIVTWDDEEVTWSTPLPTQVQGTPVICKLNQQGYAHLFAAQTIDDPSLAITGVSSSGGILQLTIPNHNLNQLETIYLTGLLFISSSTFLPVTTSLNNVIFQVFKVVDANTIQLAFWDTSLDIPVYVVVGTNTGNYPFTPVLASSTYVGGGEVTLFPKMDLISKDINLFQRKGLNTKLSRIDFLLEPQQLSTSVTVNLILNANPVYTANILIQSPDMSITNNTDLNQTGGEYQWFSFFQTLAAQYFRIELTFDDNLMNTLSTHQSQFTLYAINAWCRPGGRLIQ